MSYTLEDDITIEVEITECDLNQFRKEIIENNGTIEWVYPTNTGREFRLVFMTQDEYSQRRK